MKDVVIIGGGPAGAALGCYLARAGVDATVYEACRHPRPHVGESLVTATTRTLQEIGFLETMEREAFVHKHGASFHDYEDDSRCTLRFGEIEQAGIDQRYTYHVDRARFDHLLLEHARRQGAEVHEETRVREVLFAGERAVGVRLADGEGFRDVACRQVVDASGRTTLLGRQLGLRRADPEFEQLALYGWFRDVDRGPEGEADHIHIFFLPARRSWAWQIPLSAEITSVGVVTSRDTFRASKGRQRAFFDEQCRSSPGLRGAMADACLEGELTAEGDYSYSMDRLVGPGYLLAGDAARFVDPIFSSGVSVAFHSARFAHAALVAIREGAPEEEALAAYQRRLRAGTEVWYEFIQLYYKLPQVFTRFVMTRRYRTQLINLLQGEIYDRSEAPVLDRMRDAVLEVEATEEHPWRRWLEPIPDQAGVTGG